MRPRALLLALASKYVYSPLVGLTQTVAPSGTTADYAYDSIKGVADDGFSVTARGGSIEAPEGAEVFTISGMRVGRDNLPAGVYVVRHGGKSQKVIMK